MKDGGTATVHHVLLVLLLSLVRMASPAELKSHACAPTCRIQEQELVCGGKETSKYLKRIVSCVKEMSNVEAVVIEIEGEIDCGCKWYTFSTKVVEGGIQLVVSKPVRKCLQLTTQKCRLSVVQESSESGTGDQTVAKPGTALTDADFVMTDKGTWKTIKKPTSKTKNPTTTTVATTTTTMVPLDPQALKDTEEAELAKANLETEDFVFLMLAVAIIGAPIILGISFIVCSRRSQAVGGGKTSDMVAEMRERSKRAEVSDRLIYTWKRGDHNQPMGDGPPSQPPMGSSFTPRGRETVSRGICTCSLDPVSCWLPRLGDEPSVRPVSLMVKCEDKLKAVSVYKPVDIDKELHDVIRAGMGTMEDFSPSRNAALGMAVTPTGNPEPIFITPTPAPQSRDTLQVVASAVETDPEVELHDVIRVGMGTMEDSSPSRNAALGMAVTPTGNPEPIFITPTPAPQSRDTLQVVASAVETDPEVELHDVIREDYSLPRNAALGMTVTPTGNPESIFINPTPAPQSRDTPQMVASAVETDPEVVGALLEPPIDSKLFKEYPSVSVQTDDYSEDDTDENTRLLLDVASVQTDAYSGDEQNDSTCSIYHRRDDY